MRSNLSKGGFAFVLAALLVLVYVALWDESAGCSRVR